MPIPVTCDCGKNLNIPDQYAGQKVKCPACATTIAVPAAGGTAPKPARPLSAPLPSKKTRTDPKMVVTPSMSSSVAAPKRTTGKGCSNWRASGCSRSTSMGWSGRRRGRWSPMSAT